MLPPVISIVTVEEAPAIDGILDEAIWSDAQAVEGLERFKPADGGPPPGQTTFRFAQDDEHLFIAVEVRDDPGPTLARLGPRDDSVEDDTVGVMIDTNQDADTAYVFYANPLGIQTDWLVAYGTWNRSWDAALRSAGTLHEDGYTVEFAIPFRAMSYPDGGGPQTWGVFLTRGVKADESGYQFPHVTRGHPRQMEEMAHLQGVLPPARSRSLTLIPTLAVSQEQQLQGGELDWSGLDPALHAMRPGMDAMLGLGSTTLLHAALNPDFSQVIPDQPVVLVNQRFAFQFPERRPFFLSEADALQDPARSLYSRSIVEPLYAFKAVRRGERVTVGTIHALDRSPSASVNYFGTPGFNEADMTHARASNTLARARGRGPGRSTVGLTMGHKGLLGGSQNLLGAADAWVPLGSRWSLSAYSAASGILGSDTGVGVRNRADLWRGSGDGFGYRFEVEDITPEFRSEMGFVTQTGLRRAYFSVDHTSTHRDGQLVLFPKLAAAAWSERGGEGGAWLTTSLTNTVRGAHVIRLQADTYIRHTAPDVLFEAAGQGPFVPLPSGSYQDYPGYSLGLSYTGILSPTLRLSGTASTARTVQWGVEEIRLAHQQGLYGSAELSPGRRLRLNVIGTLNRLEPEDKPVELGLGVRWASSLHISPSLGVRYIQDTTWVNTELTDLGSSALIYWVREPGTELHAGYASARVGLGDGSLQARTLFLRLSGRLEL